MLLLLIFILCSPAPICSTDGDNVEKALNIFNSFASGSADVLLSMGGLGAAIGGFLKLSSSIATVAKETHSTSSPTYQQIDSFAKAVATRFNRLDTLTRVNGDLIIQTSIMNSYRSGVEQPLAKFLKRAAYMLQPSETKTPDDWTEMANICATQAPFDILTAMNEYVLDCAPKSPERIRLFAQTLELVNQQMRRFDNKSKPNEYGAHVSEIFRHMIKPSDIDQLHTALSERTFGNTSEMLVVALHLVQQRGAKIDDNCLLSTTIEASTYNYQTVFRLVEKMRQQLVGLTVAVAVCGPLTRNDANSIDVYNRRMIKRLDETASFISKYVDVELSKAWPHVHNTAIVNEVSRIANGVVDYADTKLRRLIQEVAVDVMNDIGDGRWRHQVAITPNLKQDDTYHFSCLSQQYGFLTPNVQGLHLIVSRYEFGRENFTAEADAEVRALNSYAFGTEVLHPRLEPILNADDLFNQNSLKIIIEELERQLGAHLLREDQHHCMVVTRYYEGGPFKNCLTKSALSVRGDVMGGLPFWYVVPYFNSGRLGVDCEEYQFAFFN